MTPSQLQERGHRLAKKYSLQRLKSALKDEMRKRGCGDMEERRCLELAVECLTTNAMADFVGSSDETPLVKEKV